MTDYLELDNPRVLAFRFRTDAQTNAALAADLRRRADALDLVPVRAAAPDPVLITRAARLVDSCTTGLGVYKRARLIRHIAATGDALWHSSWLLFGSNDGAGCDCARCRPMPML